MDKPSSDRHTLSERPDVQRGVANSASISVRGRVLVAGTAVIIAALAYFWLWYSGQLSILWDPMALRGWVARQGMWGPVALVICMVAAIVFSPIPSGPIAMVAGAVFGPLLGTIYVVTGAFAGALIAFWLARLLGYEALRRWSKAKGVLELLSHERSQNWLMGVVFVSRLIPFISFDAVSYAAGLTPLACWRFAIATLAGVVPISVLLTVFGDEMTDATPAIGIAVTLALCLITAAPIAIKLLADRRHRRRLE